MRSQLQTSEEFSVQKARRFARKIASVICTIVIVATVGGYSLHFSEKYGFMLRTIEANVVQAISIGNQMGLGQIAGSLLENSDIGAVMWTFHSPIDDDKITLLQTSKDGAGLIDDSLNRRLILGSKSYYVVNHQYKRDDRYIIGEIDLAVKIPVIEGLVALLLLFLVLYYFSQLIVRGSSLLARDLSAPMQTLSDYISSKMDGSRSNGDDVSFPFLEYQLAKKSFDLTLSKKELAESEAEKRIWDSVAAKVASKVSHDSLQYITRLDQVIASSGIDGDQASLMKSLLGKIRSLSKEIPKYEKSSDIRARSLDIARNKGLVHIFSVCKTAFDDFTRQSALESRNIDFDFSYPPHLFGACGIGEALYLDRAITNILSNAVQSIGKEVGRVELSVRRRGDGLVIGVTDDGPGISYDKLLKIRDGERISTKANGTGQGLEVCREAAQFFGGSLRVDSEEGFGCTVSLEIPVAPSSSVFSERIDVSADSMIVSLDDDVDHITGLKQRFIDLGFPEKNFVCLSDPTLTSQHFEGQLRENLIFLADYDLGSASKGARAVNGLQVIEKFGLSDKSILVTNSHTDLDVVDRSKKLGVKILPKSFLANVTINIG